VLPSLILVGIGFGLTLAPSFATATFGVPARDSGVASAMVNVSQQVGVSIATALLSALAASAATDFLTIAGPAPSWCARTPSTLRHRALVGHGVFTVDALVCGSLLRSDVRPEMTHGGAPEPAPARTSAAHLPAGSTGERSAPDGSAGGRPSRGAPRA
jgi:hypothetical protein